MRIPDTLVHRSRHWTPQRPKLLPLAAVVGKTRVIEDEFIAPNGTDATDAFRMYLHPLLGSGMPDAFRLRHHPVAKVLQPGR